MVLPNPGVNFEPKPFCELSHFIRFKVGDSARSLVVRDVSLLPKDIELFDRGGVNTDGQSQRFDDTVVMV